MKRGVAAALDPLAVVICVEVADAQHALGRTVRRHGIDFRTEAHKRRIAFEDHVELAELVTLHAVRALRIDLVPVHITIDALNHRRAPQIAFQIAKPILSVRSAQRRGIFVDERLKDAFDVRLDRRAIGGTIVLSGYLKRKNVSSKYKSDQATKEISIHAYLRTSADARYYEAAQ